MPDHSMRTRVLITAGMLVGSFALLHGLSHGEPMTLRQPLQQLPVVLGEWQGQDQPLEPRIAGALGVNDYLSRTYTDPSGQPVGLYVGFYASQWTGDTIHSPRNCLPGAGWQPLRAGRLTIPMTNAPPMKVNEYVVEKGLDRYLVLYWYQGRGRVIASEYTGKVCLVLDAITRNRTDGAMVRVFTRMRDGEENARGRAVQFVRTLYPQLSDFIPD